VSGWAGCCGTTTDLRRDASLSAHHHQANRSLGFLAAAILVVLNNVTAVELIAALEAAAVRVCAAAFGCAPVTTDSFTGAATGFDAGLSAGLIGIGGVVIDCGRDRRIGVGLGAGVTTVCGDLTDASVGIGAPARAIGTDAGAGRVVL